jgi:hypothetical protein
MSTERSLLEFSQDPYSQPGGGSGLGGAVGHWPEEFGLAPGVPDAHPSGETKKSVAGLTGADNSREKLFPAAQFPEPTQFLSDVLPFPLDATKHGRRDVWEATGYVPPIAGGALDTPTETSPQETDDELDVDRHTIWPPRPAHGVTVDLGLQRDRDLSPGGNWLVERLLGGARDYGEELDYLQWRADKVGIDLQAAIDELNRHGLLVSRKPGWIDLPWK